MASALCKLILTRQRPNDALLFYTILSTRLKDLVRRGFNVDKLLNSRKAEREAADQRMRAERLQDEIRQASRLDPSALANAVQQLAGMFPDADLAFLEGLLKEVQPPHVENAANELLTAKQDYPRKRMAGAFPVDTNRPGTGSVVQKTGSPPGVERDKGLLSSFGSQFRRKLNEVRAPSGIGAAMGDSFRNVGSSGTPSDAPSPLPSTKGIRPPVQSGSAPTSTEAIKSNVRRAIQMARPENSNAVNNAVEKTQVKESEDSYCDSTAAANLSYVADLADMRFFVSRDVPDGPAFVEDNQAALLRFITLVLQPVGEVSGYLFSFVTASLYRNCVLTPVALPRSLGSIPSRFTASTTRTAR